VRKTLRADAGGSEDRRKFLFKSEKRCLRLFNYPQHPNIVPLLSSYTHGNDHCLLFPLLDMDLAAFFERTTRYGDFQWNFTFFSALHGLSSALSRAHDIHIQAESDGLDFSAIGYHHDLRPANILVNKGTFILADFGMGRVKSEGEVSKTHWKAGIGDYLAPDCMDENFANQDVGRAVDVWAFGCLMAEVATFMYHGPEGLAKFRNSRASAGSFSNWYDSYFHDGHGNVKAAVKEWLNFLTSGDRLAFLDKPFYELILSLLTPANERPKIAHVCRQLAHLSLKAHFFAVLETLTNVVYQGPPGVVTSMKLWFEWERLKAFGNVLRLSGIVLEHSMPEIIGQHSARCVGIMLELFHQLSPVRGLPEVAEGVVNAPEPSKEASSPSTQPDEILRDNTDEPQKMLETDVQRLVEELWGLLPQAELRKAERIWVHSMLTNTESIEQLDDLERTLSSERSTMYQQGAAMAMMKKIRLELIHSPSSSLELQGLEILDTDVVKSKVFHGHQMGIYKGEVPVFIETMLYDPSWEKVPPSERTLIMAYKVTGFGVNPRPQNLRLLNCLRFFEKMDGNRLGYSFVYQVPEPRSPIGPHEHTLTTLLHLLVLSAKKAKADPHMNQPVLGDKFRLASVLAGFLAEFHSIGWFHENFQSNNIVFFNAPFDENGINPTRSKILLEPYIVGLNKSRPGGDAWHTQGPAIGTEFMDYQHPDYHQTTMRFRNAYDYYSLGLMLLEIGLWTPLRAWSGKKENRTHSPHQLRDTLVERYVPRLGSRMGEAYQDIVKLLLSDGLDPHPQTMEPDPEGERDAFNKFFEYVVDPLARLANMCV